jgi:uncharacterized membrane protein YkoI
MTRKLKATLIAVPMGAALVFGGVAIAGSTGGDDDDRGDKPIAGAALEKAKTAALAHTGGGSVTETEVGDEEGYYEVEVTRADGSQVDVHLTRDYRILGGEADDDGAGDDGPGDD